MKALRWIIGRIILGLNFLTAPRPMKRPEVLQNEIDQQTKKLSLYEFNACPFCVKVRRKIRKLNLKIELKDAMKDQATRQELLQARGKIKVPVLRIESEDGSAQWMPESSDINRYLESRFA